MTISYAVNGLRKEFGGKPAVADATFEVHEGTIHGVIGKNGAGKSVLMNMISGVMQPNGGELKIEGRVVGTNSWSPSSARAAGVMLIPQDPPRLPYLTVEDYLFLGSRSFSRWGILDRRGMRRKVGEVNERLSLDVKPGDMVTTLPVEVQQLLAFGKSVFLEGSRIVLLDEITASLSGHRRIALLQQLRDLVPGRSFTLITHHINEVIDACDRVTVMRDGVSVDTLEVQGATRHDLAVKIVGEEGGEVQLERKIHEPGDEILRIEGLSSTLAFEDVWLTVHEHEVVGIAGVDGSGKDELLEALAGLRKSRGDIVVEGRARRMTSPVAASRAGVVLLPKNRERLATIHHLSVFDNLTLPVAPRFANVLRFLAIGKMRQAANDTVATMQVNPPRIDAVINSLSGGNRQKVMMGRLRLIGPRLYLLNEPTRGVDIATKPVLLSLVRDELAMHSAVIMTSESEEELVEACDRVLIFFRGRVVREIVRSDPQFTVGEIYRTSQGVDVA